jgi:hypothetical protein
VRYETPADLAAEEEISAFVAEVFGLDRVPKLPLCYILDRVAIRAAKGITCFFEVKDRKGLAFGTDDGLYLSLYKVLKARNILAETGVPCRLVVRFAGGDVYWCDLADYDRVRGLFWFGRSDRDEDEPCVTFPWRVFKKVVGKEVAAA